MALYRSFAQLNWSRMLDAWSHLDAHKELQEIAGVPAGWRGARPFTRHFDSKKLRLAWALNGSLLLIVM
eukprot:3396787-Prymnesium_polylepis.1